MKKIKINKFESKSMLCEAIADRCADQLAKSLNEDRLASFIIPGGTTPAPAFEKLSNKSLDWQRVTIAQSDERWVSADHPQSNQGLTTRTLLMNNAKLASYLPMKNASDTPFEGESECQRGYESIQSPFSLTLLGMGADGHFASLFPGAKNLSQAMDLNNQQLCIAIDAKGCPVAGDYPQRMSLTLAGILKSKLILLMVTGEEKLSVIESAAKQNNTSDYPIRSLIRQHKTPVEIFWCA